MKLGIALDDELLGRIDRYADENYMSRSGLISLACTQFLNASEVTMAIKDLALCVRKIADNNIVDDVSLQKLEDFERMSKMLLGSR